MDVKKFDYVFSKMENDMKGVLEHSERTAMLCYALAKELDLYPDELEIAYFAGLLHEVGKLNLPNSIPIQDENFAIEKLYPYFTVSILNAFEGFDVLDDVMLQHQENIDGSGYPKGLQGEEINIVARILRIADFYDSQRAKGLSHDDTTKLLRENSDIIFPRKIITPFIKSVIKNELQFDYKEN